MHAGDLGIFQDAVGSLLFLEIANKAWHPSFAAGLRWLNGQLREYYKAHPGLSQLQLTYGMLRPRDTAYPTLRCKAAECRHLAGFALTIAQRRCTKQFTLADERLAPHSVRYRELALSMAEGLQGYHESCTAEPLVETTCRDALHLFLNSTVALRQLFRMDLPPHLHDSQPFNYRPKGHMMDHVVNEKIQLWGSPRHFWCYADEDFVGLVKRIVVMTKHPKTLEVVLLKKYRLFAALWLCPMRYVSFLQVALSNEVCRLSALDIAQRGMSPSSKLFADALREPPSHPHCKIPQELVCCTSSVEPLVYDLNTLRRRDC
jgi:hypothetical protein